MQVNRDLDYGFVTDRGGFLRQKAQRAAAVNRDFSLVRLFAPEDHIDERRFPGAVRAHKPDPLATTNLERGALEQLTSTKALADIDNRKHFASG
jgi:hypothetical protein